MSTTITEVTITKVPNNANKFIFYPYLQMLTRYATIACTTHTKVDAFPTFDTNFILELNNIFAIEIGIPTHNNERKYV